MFQVSTANRAATFNAALLVCLILMFLGGATHGSDGTRGFEIVRTEFLGSVWNQGHAKASIISQDGGYSYSVPGGTLWWFGDTFRGTRDREGKPHFAGGAVSCSVAFLDENTKAVPPVLDFFSSRDNQVSQAITFLPGESWEHHRIWPLGGIYVNGVSYVYYSLIELTGEGTWGFRGAGSGLSRSAQPLGVYKRVETEAGWKFPVAPSAVVMAGGWVYLFDVEKRRGQHGIWLSRVRPKDIESPKAYEFYVGPGPEWSRNKDREVLLMKNIYGQASVAWNEYLKRYVLASSSDFFRPREIRFHTAEEPFGPWSEAVARITLPERMQGKKVSLVYCSFLHPELFREKGRVMNLTCSLHLEDAGFDANNEMVEIEMK